MLLLDAKCKTFDKVPGSAKNLFNESYKVASTLSPAFQPLTRSSFAQKSPDWGTSGSLAACSSALLAYLTNPAEIAFFSKVSPIFVQRGFDWLGHAAHEEWTARAFSALSLASLLIESAGCIVAEFENTYLVGTYVHCGSGAGDHASDTFAKVKRESWVVAFSAFMTSLVSRARSEKKGIIWTGELAHVASVRLLIRCCSTGDLSACVDPELGAFSLQLL